MAKKASPTPSVRESMDTPLTVTARSPATSAPCVARTISWMVKPGRRRLMTGPPSACDAPPRRRRHARHHLVDDRLRIFRARIVGGHPHPVRQARGDLAHEGTLAPVAVTAAAEHDAEAPPRDFACGREHPLERIRRVRVVHDD